MFFLQVLDFAHKFRGFLEPPINAGKRT